MPLDLINKGIADCRDGINRGVHGQKHLKESKLIMTKVKTNFIFKKKNNNKHFLQLYRTESAFNSPSCSFSLHPSFRNLICWLTKRTLKPVCSFCEAVGGFKFLVTIKFLKSVRLSGIPWSGTLSFK